MGGSRKSGDRSGRAGLLARSRCSFCCSGRTARRRSQQAGSARGTYVGVATCGGTTCHGRSEARRRGRPPGRAHALAGPVEPPPARTAAPGGAARAARQGDRRSGSASARRPSAPMCLGCHATPRRGAARRPLPDSPTGSAAKAATAPPRGWLAEPLCGRRHPCRQRRRAAWSRSTIRGPAPPSASTAISAAPTTASSSTTGSWPPATRGSLRARPVHDAPAASQRGRRLSPAQGPRPNGVQIWAVGQAMALERSLDPVRRPAARHRGHLPRILFLRLPHLPPPDLRRSALPSRPRSPIRAGRSRRACRPTMTRT